MKIDGLHYDVYGGSPIDRFDLEEKIMNAWKLSDDIKLLFKSAERMDTDQMMSALDGLQIFADMRFEELWDTFEKCVQNGGFRSPVEQHEEDDTIILFDPDTGDTMEMDRGFVINDDNRRADEIAKAMDEATKGFGQEQIQKDC